MSEPRAVVFDLDDTLYPFHRFVLSGFAAVAEVVAREVGVPPELVRRTLGRASRAARGRELQQLCRRFSLPASDVARLVEIVRGHTPHIRLPQEAVRVLAALRPRWRLGVLTNGLAAIQRRKVSALGLAGLVDAVVFAAECGDGRGKPDRAGFLTVLDRLGTPAERTVFVGDNLDADMVGARRVGMRTIHVARGPCKDGRTANAPDVRVERLRSVPPAADRLVGGGWRVDTV